MQKHTPSLDWIEAQQAKMVERLIVWAGINSSSDNLPGLSKMLSVLEKDFSILNGNMERIALPPRSVISPSGEPGTHPIGEALRITKRPNAAIKILLAGHMDTVYPLSHPFQNVSPVDGNILRGPGVADMKGGLLIMLTALEALERHPAAENVGWEVLINPDEEIGSVGSEHLFREAAKRCQLGLIFEPSFTDGGIVSSRKGSMNISVVAKGKAAHAGRDFDKGYNAILALADFIGRASQLNDCERGISINPGHIMGGGPVNIVPDLAICRMNLRAIDKIDFINTSKKLLEIVNSNKITGVQLTLHIESMRIPKLFDENCSNLFEMINQCAKDEGYTLIHRPSGGVCDGNILAEEGMPVIDTLGVIGGDIHTSNEYILIDSLVKRSRLIGLFLTRLATGGGVKK
ncbi:MAG TPA: hydrolase [Parachlamydiaceae bacterium]|nr:hydrolase [Parachlamydiaceae bacterium]